MAFELPEKEVNSTWMKRFDMVLGRSKREEFTRVRRGKFRPTEWRKSISTRCERVLAGGKVPYEHFTRYHTFEQILHLMSPEASPPRGPQARLVFMLRNNTFDRSFSRVLMNNGAAHQCTASQQGLESCAKTNLTVDVEYLRILVNQFETESERMYDEVMKWAIKFKTPLLYIRYEDLLRDPRTMLHQHVLPFLGLDGNISLETELVRRTGDRTHREMIANYEEVRAALADMGFEHYLEDEATRKEDPVVLLLHPPDGMVPVDAGG